MRQALLPHHHQANHLQLSNQNPLASFFDQKGLFEKLDFSEQVFADAWPWIHPQLLELLCLILSVEAFLEILSFWQVSYQGPHNYKDEHCPEYWRCYHSEVWISLERLFSVHLLDRLTLSCYLFTHSFLYVSTIVVQKKISFRSHSPWPLLRRKSQGTLPKACFHL